jgi:hypothetical protein
VRRADGDPRARAGLQGVGAGTACATVDERLERIALEYLDAVAGVVIDSA